MNKIKVVTIVGTRPELIRLSRTIFELDKNCEHILVHTGQNFDYELNRIFFKDLKIREPNYFLNCSENSKSSAQTIGNVINHTDLILSKVKPDAVLVLGDTNSCLSIIAAKKRKIPIFHMEAGNRCFDMRVPEEINRKIVDHVADINLTYSDLAKNYLIKEGIPADHIIKTGSPMLEIINYYKKNINSSKILIKLKVKKNKYFLISSHREEIIDSEKQFKKLIDNLNLLAKDYQYPIIVSVHPRTSKKIIKKKIKFHNKINLIKPLGYFDYMKLQINSKAVLSDSGTITEESSILNFPALNIRESHERPEGMEEGSVMMTGLSYNRIKQCLKILETQSRGNKRDLNIVNDYSSINVSKKVLRIIHSYIDFVNHTVWNKN